MKLKSEATDLIRAFFIYLIYFKMIYKFENDSLTMEVELFNEDNQFKEINDNVEFRISDADIFINYSLEKKEVFKLIGVLHLLHKEMK